MASAHPSDPTIPCSLAILTSSLRMRANTAYGPSSTIFTVTPHLHLHPILQDQGAAVRSWPGFCPPQWELALMLSHVLNRFCGAGIILHGVIRAGLRVGLGGDICLHAACQHSSASCWCAWGATLVVSPSSQCCVGWCCRLLHGCHIWTIWREGMMWGVGVNYGEWRFAGSQEGSSVH
jgi:hypothetical protein